jgi:hypothetical protein
MSRLSDLLRDAQFQSDVGHGTTDALNRGLVAQVLGAPADMGNTLINLGKAGYGAAGRSLGLLKADEMPELEDKPVGGSEWFGDLMHKHGMVTANRNPVAETIAGSALGPLLGAEMPKIAPALIQAGENLQASQVGPRGRQRGAVNLGLQETPTPARTQAASDKTAATVAALREPAKGTVTPKVQPITFDITTPEGAAAFRAREGRSPVHLMDEAERVQHFGPGAAETPVVPMSDLRSRRELYIPGGIGEDAPPMTLADQAKISAQAIDYNDLDPKLALDIHKRLVKSVDPGANPSDLELMNRLGFGVTSGNAPITKNLLEWSQMRPRSAGEMNEWSRYSPVGIGEQMPSRESANQMNRDINAAYGVQASERGGTGTANTANRQYVSDLASMLREKPDYFRKQPGEPDYQYVERLMNQVRGLGPKTGSLGFAMVEPQTTNISAIDRHIADLTREHVANNPSTADLYEQQMLNAYNRDKPPEAKHTELGPAQIEAGEAGPGIEAEHFRDIVSSPQTRVYREAATGQPRADLPPHLQNLPFYEPTHSAEIGPIYNAALKQIEEGGKPRGIGGFSNQWHDWDFQRSRAEPHAGMNPQATQMPRLTPEEYGQVRDKFSEMGAMRTTKEPDTGRLRPLTKTRDWKKLLYWTAPTAATTPALIKALRGEDEEGGM